MSVSLKSPSKNNGGVPGGLGAPGTDRAPKNEGESDISSCESDVVGEIKLHRICLKVANGEPLTDPEADLLNGIVDGAQASVFSVA